MIVKIAEIKETKPKTSKAGKPYILTTFEDTLGNSYSDVYGSFTAGQEVEGDWVEGEYGRRFEIKRPSVSSGPFRGPERQFKADPESRQSIEWQTSLKSSLEAVRDYMTFAGGLPKTDGDLEWYIKQIDRTAVHFKKLINEGKEHEDSL